MNREIYDAIGYMSKQLPNWRFGQFLSNLEEALCDVGYNDPFYIDDKDMPSLLADVCGLWGIRPYPVWAKRCQNCACLCETEKSKRWFCDEMENYCDQIIVCKEGTGLEAKYNEEV